MLFYAASVQTGPAGALFDPGKFVDRATGGKVKPKVFINRVTGGKVSTRTPLGRNGLGYQPLKKPLGNKGKDIERWVHKYQGPIIIISATIVAAAIMQPELSAWTLKDIAITASSDGVAIGISVSPTSKKHSTASVPSAHSEEYDVPLWPLGLPSTLFQQIKAEGENALDDPRVGDLLRFVENPKARSLLLMALDQAEEINWPANANPALIKQIIAMNREAIDFGDFLVNCKREKHSLHGIESDPRFLELWKRADARIAKIRKLAPSEQAMQDATTSVLGFTKPQVTVVGERPVQAPPVPPHRSSRKFSRTPKQLKNTKQRFSTNRREVKSRLM